MFGPATLIARLQRTFTRVAQLAGGKAGELLGDNEEFNRGHVKFHRCILNTDEKPGVKYDAKLFRDRLLKVCGSDANEQAFVKGFMDEVDKLKLKDAKPGELKRAVKKKFVEAFAIRSKTRFAAAWLKNQDQIDEQEKLFAGLYALRLGLDVTGTSGAAGAAGTVVTAVSVPELDDEVREDRKKNYAVAVGRTERRLPRRRAR